MKNILKGKNIFITGGTGSFGKNFVSNALLKLKPKRITIYSRDEMKQWEMQNQYQNEKRLNFVIGDIRDKDRLGSLWMVWTMLSMQLQQKLLLCRIQSFETIKTNVIGAMNLIDASIEANIGV